MTYQVLARKWRPQDFSSLVGQEHIVKALRNGLTEGRIAQAYLFSGIRGVGKTTAARVLAKALQCQKGPAADPCNECPACLDISDGKNLDVLEIDAATYSKVEQVRELTESLRYGPASCRYKVVVLDEVHRLSRQAFDALLKIVEEPPAHLLFIFATTEIDAVPATILSRCQEYQFRRVPSGILSGHLRTICEAEGIEASDAALRMIAKAGEGSVRDSVALLDQMATFGNDHIRDEDAQALFGGLDTTIFQELLTAILEGRSAAIVEQVRTIDANGWDPNNVFRQFLSYARDGLHLAMGGATQSVDLPEEEAEALRERVRAHGYEPLLQISSLLLSSEASIRRSEMGILALEIALLRAAELPKVVRIQEILSSRALPPTTEGGGGQGHYPQRGPSDGEAPRPGGSSAQPDRSRAQAPRTAELGGNGGPSNGHEGASEASAMEAGPDPEPDDSPPDSIEPPLSFEHPVDRSSEATGLGEKDPEHALAPLDTAPLDTAPLDPPAEETLDPSRLPALMEILGRRRQSRAALFASARLDTEGPRLRILPEAGDRHLRNALERKRNIECLAHACHEAWGRPVDWVIDSESALAGDLESEPLRGTASRNASGPAGERGGASFPSAMVREPPADPAPREPGGFWPSGPEERDALPSYPSGRATQEISREDLEEVTALPVVAQVMKLFGGRIESVRVEDSRPDTQESRT
ncbi:MAG: DNA polymerase III subunit gamma/tau [Holophagales bacterium]|nr:DNA polymerase III subunit gamma/tau [Holophagales bacterium]